MNTRILKNAEELGIAAAETAISLINENLEQKDHANIILATGASQFQVLQNLVQANIDWEKVTMFHLDEYIGMSATHPASFRKYLTDRFLKKIDFACKYHLINGENPDPQAECDRVGKIIGQHPIDVALIGIGENGHLAFNDPPADFETEDPYLVVQLDDACRQQQYGEGWFDSFDGVPSTAISMSIRQILKSRHLIVSVPDERKSEAVKNALKGEITNLCPASILRNHASCHLFLDTGSASKL
ncbi:MAG: glucosamine-6-phosphate deaminase [Saprospiraceae bacterium]|nr:glucosamine-6-phosphate deaminase [Saprospiraceae bacterium]